MKELILILNLSFLQSCIALGCSNNNKCSRCDGQSGNCVECTAGLFGPQCRDKCRPNCKHDTCRLEAGRDICTDGCKPGFYGTRCLVPCRLPGQGCVKCLGGCQDKFCLDNQACVSGCHNSHYGSKCSNCSHFCKECDHVAGVCKECIRDYGGSTCSVSCKNCLGSCNIGGCPIGCKPGYYGAFCNDVCDDNCVDGCDQGKGNCNHCKEGRYGPFCKSRCGMECVNKTCTLDGHCLHGCKDGYFVRNCASSTEEVCIKYMCKGETRLFCLQLCNTSRQSCRDEPINCSESCLNKLSSKVCKETATPTTSEREISTSTEAPREEDDFLVIYLAVSVTGLLVMMIALFIYFYCRFQRIRRITYGSVRNPTIPMIPTVEPVEQPMPSDAHEYDEVEDTPFTIDLTNPIIAEVFRSAGASAGQTPSFPRIANYSTISDVSAEGKYLTPQVDPLQRPSYRRSV